MTPVIFDGKAFAGEKEKLLKGKVDDIRKRNITPKLITILVGNDPASRLYVSLKKKAAERVGCVLEIKEFEGSVSPDELIHQIELLGGDISVNGIMVQLPLPLSMRNHTQKVLDSIPPEKDVDGLRNDSPYKPAVVRAIISILGSASLPLKPYEYKVCIVGVKGNVGRRLEKELKLLGYVVTGLDKEDKDLALSTKDADILISVTGVPELIKGSMVKKGAIVIDVGSPKGDILFTEVAKKASFITPVPGGVGPVTVVSLLENLVQGLEA